MSYGVYLWHQGFTDKAMTWTDSVPLHANFVLVTAIAVALQRRAPRRCRGTSSSSRSTAAADVPLRKWLRPAAAAIVSVTR